MNKNAIYNGIGYLINPLLMIISTPILIQNIGVEKYGLWILIITTLSTFTMFQFGIGETVTKKVSENLSFKHFELNKVATSGIFLYLILATIISSLFLIASIFDENQFKNYEEILIIVSLVVFFIFLKESMTSVLKGLSRYDLISIQNIILALVKNLSFILVVIISKEILFLLYTLLIISIIDVVITYILFKNEIKKHNILILKKDLIYILKFKKYMFFSGMQSLTTILFTQGDKFIVGSLVGFKELAIYSAFLQIATQLQQLLSAMYSYVFPKISLWHSEEKYKEITCYFKKLSSRIFIFSLIGTICLLLAGKKLLEIWLNDIPHVEKYINSYYLLICAYFFLAQNIIPHYFLNAIGKVKDNLSLMTLTYLFTFISMLLFIPFLGVLGASLSKFLIVIPIIFYVRRTRKILYEKFT